MDAIIGFVSSNIVEILSTVTTVLSLLVGVGAAKIGRVMPLLNSVVVLSKTYKEADRDGNRTIEEKAELYDKEHKVLEEVRSILIGPFWNRSKTRS